MVITRTMSSEIAPDSHASRVRAKPSRSDIDRATFAPADRDDIPVATSSQRRVDT